LLFYSELLHISEDSVTGDDQQTQHVINCAVLPRLHKLLSNDGKGILKEACWAPSNIASGSKQQLQAVIDHNISPALAHTLETEDFEIRKECAWAISNATSGDNV
jgi:importin subunit alpha-6/7